MARAIDTADAHALEILGQAELRSLKNSPGTIVPFVASEISWSVSRVGDAAA